MVTAGVAEGRDAESYLQVLAQLAIVGCVGLGGPLESKLYSMIE